MNVPLLDLKAQYDTIRTELEQAMRAVMESQHFILGPHVQRCEEAIAAYCQAPHAIGVSSGAFKCSFPVSMPLPRPISTSGHRRWL